MLCAFLVLAVTGYFRNYSTSVGSDEILVLLIGLVSGQAAVCLKVRWRTLGEQNAFAEGVIVVLIWGLLLCVGLCPKGILHLYHYHGSERWSGVWGNPNVFGTFCGVGLLFSAGLVLKYAIRCGRNARSLAARRRTLCIPATLVYLAAMAVFAVGLLHSYSRGAWLGVAVGAAYLCIQVGSGSVSRLGWTKRFHVASGWLAAAFLCLLLLPGCVPANPLLARLKSLGDLDDLSWRNRLTSSRAALNILADRPFWGAGWGQAERTYEQFYLPERLTETAAITQNGYLYLGMEAGLPVLTCLFAYLVLVVHPLSLAQRSAVGHGHLKDLAARPLGCQAAVFALLTIFLFDGGLTNVWLSPLFWVSLSLARDLPTCDVPSIPLETRRPGLLTAPFWLQRGIRIKHKLGLAVWCSGVRANILLIVLLSLLGGLFASKAVDPYQRIQFTLNVGERRPLRCVALAPKHWKRNPVVLYAQGAGVGCVETGIVLRQFANAGFAAVAMDYTKTNEASFNEEINRVHQYVASQSWADPEAIVWVGSSLGAQRVLSAALQHAGMQPAALVRICGGWIEPLRRYYGISSPDYPAPAGELRPALQETKRGRRLRCPVLLVHGTADQAFSIQTARELARALAADRTRVELWELRGLDHFLGEKRPVVIRMVAEWCWRTVSGNDFPPPSRLRCASLLWLAAYGAWFLSATVVWRLVLRLRPSGLRKQPPWLWPLSTVLCFALLIRGVAPLLPATRGTIAIARFCLVPPAQRPDLDWLSTQPGCDAHTLGTLSDQLKLAARGKEILHKGLSANDQRAFLLSPSLGGSGLHDFKWRRILWQFFYPRVRTDWLADRAPEIVAQSLRERVGTSLEAPGGQTVEEMWRLGWAHPRDFERLSVAAMRAAGIAARLGPDGRAEIWMPHKATWGIPPLALDCVKHPLPQAAADGPAD